MGCDYFDQNPNAVLKDDPDAPVDYVVTCRMSIKSNVKVEPGVVIEFEKNTGFVVKDKGSLDAVGTAAKRIVFRGTIANKGHWDGIFFDTSSSTDNILDYVEVSDGGGREQANRSQGGVAVYARSQLKLTNSTLKNNEQYGFSGSVADFNTSIVQNNTFIDNPYPALINTVNLDLFKNNNFKDNENQVVLVRGVQVVEDDITWHKADVPYRLENSFDVDVLLTIEAGARIEMPQTGVLKLREHNGGLHAVGTASDPIIFTSKTENPKAWGGIYITSKYAGNKIAFAEFHYSGMNEPAANVYLWYDSALTIHDVKFTNIGGCGINWRFSSGNKPNPNLVIGSNITVDEGGCRDKTYQIPVRA